MVGTVGGPQAGSMGGRGRRSPGIRVGEQWWGRLAIILVMAVKSGFLVSVAVAGGRGLLVVRATTLGRRMFSAAR